MPTELNMYAKIDLMYSGIRKTAKKAAYHSPDALGTRRENNMADVIRTKYRKLGRHLRLIFRRESKVGAGGDD